MPYLIETFVSGKMYFFVDFINVSLTIVLSHSYIFYLMMIYWQLNIKNYENMFRASQLVACLHSGVPPLKEEFRADKPLLLD